MNPLGNIPDLGPPRQSASLSSNAQQTTSQKMKLSTTHILMFVAGLAVSKLSLPYILSGIAALLVFVTIKGRRKTNTNTAEPSSNGILQSPKLHKLPRVPGRSIPNRKPVPQPSEPRLSTKRIGKSVDEEYAFRPYG